MLGFLAINIQHSTHSFPGQELTSQSLDFTLESSSLKLLAIFYALIYLPMSKNYNAV